MPFRFYHAGMARTRLLVSLVVLALVAPACSNGARIGGEPPEAQPVLAAGNATEAPLLPTNAYELPAFDLARYEELLRQLEGTPVVVNIWGSWCPPCRGEAPFLAEAHAEYGDRVQFLGVDILDYRDSARGFMEEFGWTYPSLFDEAGAIRDQLGYIGQPITIFYDATGRIAADWGGPISREILFRNLERIAGP